MKMFALRNIVIRVDFPALTDLVGYLQSQSQQQQQIDALTAQVEQLTAGLKQSTEGLDTAVKQEQ